MLERRASCGTVVRRLAMLALVLAPLLAGAAESDPRIAQNPALSHIAAADPADAEGLLDAIDRALWRPAPPRMRGAFGIAPADEALIAENPLLGRLYAHDPAAAVALLERVKAAGRRQ